MSHMRIQVCLLLKMQQCLITKAQIILLAQPNLLTSRHTTAHLNQQSLWVSLELVHLLGHIFQVIQRVLTAELL